jgi:hypothetical protein
MLLPVQRRRQCYESASFYADPEADPTMPIRYWIRLYRSGSGSDDADPEADPTFKFDVDPKLTPSYEIKKTKFVVHSQQLVYFVLSFFSKA